MKDNLTVCEAVEMPRPEATRKDDCAKDGGRKAA